MSSFEDMKNIEVNLKSILFFEGEELDEVNISFESLLKNKIPIFTWYIPKEDLARNDFWNKYMETFEGKNVKSIHEKIIFKYKN